MLYSGPYTTSTLKAYTPTSSEIHLQTWWSPSPDYHSSPSQPSSSPKPSHLTLPCVRGYPISHFSCSELCSALLVKSELHFTPISELCSTLKLELHSNLTSIVTVHVKQLAHVHPGLVRGVGCIYAPYKVNPNIFQFYFRCDNR